MERNKGMAILIAIATAMLVIVAGKSCADDIQKKNNARRAQQPARSQQSTTYGFDEDFEGVRNRLVIEMLYDTGMRRSELIGIRNVDVDYEAMQVKVTGKRNKQRLIPFAEGLKNLMLAYTEVRDREVEAAGEWFFVRKNGNQLSTGIVYNIVKKQLSEIPMLAKRSPHVLRHSFATSMLNNGAELNTVKDLLGHSSLASTSVYTHTTFEELKKVYHAHPRAKKEGGYYGR